MISIAVESLNSFWDDAARIFPIHWADLALDQDKIPMGMDRTVYEKVEREGHLHLLTVRDDGNLVGYYIAIVLVHPHYKDAGLMSTTDMFYVMRSYRRGGIGAKLILMAEQTLRERGVKKAFIGTKLHQDHAELFSAMGWKATDVVYAKLL